MTHARTHVILSGMRRAYRCQQPRHGVTYLEFVALLACVRMRVPAFLPPCLLSCVRMRAFRVLSRRGRVHSHTSSVVAKPVCVTSVWPRPRSRCYRPRSLIGGARVTYRRGPCCRSSSDFERTDVRTHAAAGVAAPRHVHAGWSGDRRRAARTHPGQTHACDTDW